MKRYLLCLLVLCFPSVTFPAMPIFTGQQLFAACFAATDILDNNFGRVQMQSEYIQGSKSGICQGYILSVVEDNFSSCTRRAPAFCLPDNYNMLIGARAVVQYLRSYPRQQCLTPNQIVLNAFRMAFPCRYVSLR